MNNQTNFTQTLKIKLESGLSFEEALLYLRENDASPVETIIAIREVKKISLSKAKELFMSSDSWQDIAKDADMFHKEIINLFK